MESLTSLGWLAKLRPQGLGGLAQIDPVTGQPAVDAQMGNAVAAPVLGDLLRGAWDMTDYPRRVLQGEAQAIDPATGHVSPDAVGWAMGQAAGRLPSPYARSMRLRASQFPRTAYATDSNEF